MPLVAPVMTATLPLSRPMSFSFQFGSEYRRPDGTMQVPVCPTNERNGPEFASAAPARAYFILGPILDLLIG